MKKILSAMLLAALLFSTSLILADSSECRAKCKYEYENCTNRCMVMAADNTLCLKRCEEQAATCMVICGGEGSDEADQPEEWKNKEEDADDSAAPVDDWPFGDEDDE